MTVRKKLKCGHAKTYLRELKYRCNLAPACTDVHMTLVCAFCGNLPVDHGFTLKLTKVKSINS